MAASGFLRIYPPVLEAAEPGEKDGVGCQGKHEASERSREERARERVMRGVGSESRVMAITSPRSARTRPRPPP